MRRWLTGNVITDMEDAGIALMESFGNNIHDNDINGAKFGIRMNLGAGDNEVYENTFNDISDGEQLMGGCNE